MMDLAPGRRLGDRFVLVRRLAEAAGAEAWLAEDTVLERRVALKLVAGDPLEDAAAARLAAELERLRALPPGVPVEVLGLHRADGFSILAMEYLPGGDLGQFRGRPYGVFARALGDVARSLEAVHAAGLVHRDLKCGNVLLDDDGRARLADFSGATLAGQAVGGGSLHNVSPQQLRGEPASPADDLYAFGVLIYELLSARPPWYPDITPDRVLHEPVPPLLPRHPAPERLRRLALRLLAKSPAQRLSTMAEVRAELAAALAEAPDESAVVLAPAAPAAAGPTPSRRPWLVSAAALALLAAALAVFLWLPQRVGNGGDGAAGEIAAAAQADAERRKQAEADAASLEQARVAAEADRDKLDAKLAALDARGAASWAVEDMAAARRARAEGERQHQARVYTTAAAVWQQGLAGLEALEARLPQLVAAAVAEGRAALDAGRSRAARDAFQRALAIEPDNAAAKRGLARAESLDEVLARLDSAARDEQAGRLAQAEQGYRAALALDAEAPGAEAALARIAAGRQGDAYAAAMARGLAALADGRSEEAREALGRALALRPGSKEAEDALAQVGAREKAGTLAAIEQRAREAERAERWKDAEKAWTEARQLEPTLIAAQEGLARAVPRVALEGRMAALLSSPERVWTPAGRAEARAVIDAVAAAGAPKQRLEAEARELSSRVAAAEVPLRVALTSDGLTEVVINRVGRFGAFQSREVELLPGRYAVVGTRQGYRDVRRELLVTPEGPPPSLMIRCEEPI
ncbi:MAG: protein kinase [Steroidobacteraceae bacterium]|jgi:tetratricopeptide (TPR) repeat protein|nr:protein kinase [Steroidobacteraceae bacterium]